MRRDFDRPATDPRPELGTRKARYDAWRLWRALSDPDEADGDDAPDEPGADEDA